MVADEPVAPDLLAQLLEQPIAVDRAVVHRAGRGVRRGRSRLRAGQGRRRLPLPDPRRPGALRRALPARRPAGPACPARRSETLAIVAYKQPISRAQIASIRGVDPDGVLRTLQARGYVDRGRPATPGPARRSCTARPPSFLEKLGPRLARRSAADRRVRARRRRRRGPRARPAHRRPGTRCPRLSRRCGSSWAAQERRAATRRAAAEGAGRAAAGAAGGSART